MGNWFSESPTSPEPSTFDGLDDNTANWTCGDWIIYYKRNLALLGKDQAVEIVTFDMEHSPEFFNNLFYCGWNCDFVTYFQNEGVNIGSFVSDVSCIAEDVVETVKSVTDSTAKFGKFILPAALVLGGFYIVSNLDEIKKSF